MEKIPLILVLGFLGSGKTSFIKNLLHSDPEIKRPAIIQNEFAPAAIDAEELRHEKGNITILEINGGSVFCVCRLDNFIPSLAAFIADVQPGVLILEASGISDPLSLAEILGAPALSDRIYYSGAVCLADCHNFVPLQKINTRVKEQVRMADLVLLNKTDQASPEEINASEETIRELNPGCEIQQTVYGRANDAVQKITGLNHFYLVNRKPPAGSSGLKTAVVRSVKKISPASLDRFLTLVLPHTLRLKGFVNLDDGRTVMIQAVCEEKTITNYSPYNGPSQVIAIGETLDPHAFSAAFREA